MLGIKCLQYATVKHSFTHARIHHSNKWLPVNRRTELLCIVSADAQAHGFVLCALYNTWRYVKVVPLCVHISFWIMLTHLYQSFLCTELEERDALRAGCEIRSSFENQHVKKAVSITEWALIQWQTMVRWNEKDCACERLAEWESWRRGRHQAQILSGGRETEAGRQERAISVR